MLKEEIEAARREIVTDGYEMSIGEIGSLYANEEIIISPDFQRLFRWDQRRRTRFIESLLLGIPIPPIFVYQDEDGVWELIDGLQRLSTIFEFMGTLRSADGGVAPPSSLISTKFLPSLSGMRWVESSADAGDGIGRLQQLQIKRARMRVEILKNDSDPRAKYELFQRLNTGGAGLSEQEVRNCVAVMVNRGFYQWLVRLAALEQFRTTSKQTSTALDRQSDVELVLRFLAFRHVKYDGRFDVHEYLDDALVTLATDANFDMSTEEAVFSETFGLLQEALGDKAFVRWDGTRFSGKFLMSVFEVVATGVAANLEQIRAMSKKQRGKFLTQRVQALWSNEDFRRYSGAGVRGTTRLAKLVPLAAGFMKP